MNILSLGNEAVSQFVETYGVSEDNPILSMNLDQLKAHRSELESKANALMGEDEFWTYCDLDSVDTWLCNEIIEADEAIAELERHQA